MLNLKKIFRGGTEIGHTRGSGEGTACLFLCVVSPRRLSCVWDESTDMTPLQRSRLEKKGYTSYEDRASGWLSSSQFTLSLVSAESDLMSIVRVPTRIPRAVFPPLFSGTCPSLTHPTADSPPTRGQLSGACEQYTRSTHAY